MKAYIKPWYDYLKEGKIMGTKCKKCGAINFPPAAICNACSGMEMDWVEMSGEGEMIAATAAPGGFWPYSETPKVIAWVVMKEGMNFQGELLDVKISDLPDLWGKYPIPVKAEIVKLDDETNFPAFRIVK
jgi:uncharacterized OB-fold protein